MQLLEVEMLFVTNAAGGINLGFTPGDVMIIRDHINLIGMAGLNPLRGPNLGEFGPRFPDMSQAYDPELRSLARQVAVDEKIPFHEGVYICLAGPSFETPADVRFLRTIGVDAVGMSTVPEVTVARHGGTRVLGLSGVSNVLGAEAQETTHEEVLEAGRLLVPRMETIIKGVLQRV
jgi:purine-nucleoside phosphorylase